MTNPLSDWDAGKERFVDRVLRLRGTGLEVLMPYAVGARALGMWEVAGNAAFILVPDRPVSSYGILAAVADESGEVGVPDRFIVDRGLGWLAETIRKLQANDCSPWDHPCILGTEVLGLPQGFVPLSQLGFELTRESALDWLSNRLSQDWIVMVGRPDYLEAVESTWGSPGGPRSRHYQLLSGPIGGSIAVVQRTPGLHRTLSQVLSQEDLQQLAVVEVRFCGEGKVRFGEARMAPPNVTRQDWTKLAIGLLDRLAGERSLWRRERALVFGDAP